mgnify:CR=1 FL=1
MIQRFANLTSRLALLSAFLFTLAACGGGGGGGGGRGLAGGSGGVTTTGAGGGGGSWASTAAGAGGDDLAFLRLLLDGVRQDDAALGHLLAGHGLDDDAVAMIEPIFVEYHDVLDDWGYAPTFDR